MFAVCVLFEIKPGDMDRFKPLIEANAAASVANEPGCSRFDVCTDPDRPNHVFLYEIYDNADAFAEHRKTPHFLTFDAAVGDMTAAKTVNTYNTVFKG